MTETTPYTAVKVIYNRKTRTYELDVIRNACLHYIHEGYFVYETANPQSALDMINKGICLSTWKPEHRLRIIGFLGLE